MDPSTMDRKAMNSIPTDSNTMNPNTTDPSTMNPNTKGHAKDYGTMG